MNKLAQKIELASHIAIIIVAALISIVLVKNYLLPDSKTKSNAGNNAAIASNAVEAGIVGKVISLPDMDWKRSDQSLVLVLSTGCRYCTESASFYKELVQKRKQGSTRLVAILPQPVDASKKYLSEIGIAVDDVKQLPPNSIGVHGTPTLLLVNKDGVVTNAWRGKLPADKEREVIARL